MIMRWTSLMKHNINSDDVTVKGGREEHKWRTILGINTTEKSEISFKDKEEQQLCYYKGTQLWVASDMLDNICVN